MSQAKVNTFQSSQPQNPSLSLEFHPRKNDFTKWIKIWFSRLTTPVYLKSEASIKKEILLSGIFSSQELAPTNNTRFQKELVTHFQLKLNENRGNARKKVLGLKEYKKYLGCTTKALAEFIFSDVPITDEQLKKAAMMRQIAIKHGYMADPTKDENFWTTFHEIHTSICNSEKSADIFETILIEDRNQFASLEKSNDL
ncbi:hypothetical protein K493DRAFT_316869 [Basidiobolus meristosporus CBS 931.73]|uniref:Uncharacterized protein n=1 Tax=Basidiobolus meristosporus CBS 931.73 TaxID=1314790 RepID=A0A1Y1Y1Y4_9FUNG|nr:hypothetical protein K493DRAFT_316869 [Basidiobolus meristosporus CBS 931.73]|eukprot:ORX91969.1 hypothetical protein K493DRAFT_316869 [Basidiobolus meristosporus CBS 931.73]